VTWGSGSWGGSPWGIGVVLPPPILSAVTPAIVEREGGTILKLFGENFFAPMTLSILTGITPIAEAFMFDPEFDLQRNRAFYGLPALPDGYYNLQVTTAGGDSNILFDAIEYRLFSEEVKAHRIRTAFAAPWATGPRILTNNLEGLDL
jgi:hypothetical protein